MIEAIKSLSRRYSEILVQNDCLSRKDIKKDTFIDNLSTREEKFGLFLSGRRYNSSIN